MKTQSYLEPPEHAPFDQLVVHCNLSADQLRSQLDRLKTAPIADIYLQSKQTQVWTLDRGQIKEVSTTYRKGLGVRAVSGPLASFAYADEISSQALIKATSQVSSTLKYHESCYQGIEAGSSLITPYFLGVSLLQPELAEGFASRLLGLEQQLRARYPSIFNVQIRLSIEDNIVCVMNESGLVQEDVRPLMSCRFFITVEKEGRTEMGSSALGGAHTFAELTALLLSSDRVDLEETAEKAVKQAFVNLAACAAPAGMFKVLLGPSWPGILLHEAVGHGLEADAIRQETSCFANKLGQKVASELCTVIDDGTIPGGRGSLSIDDEGTLTSRTTLIKDGMLVGYLQDRMNSALMNRHTTGNGRRQSYAHLPIPRMTNTFLLPGNEHHEALLERMDTGLLALGFGGGQVDPTSGRFSFTTSEAYWVEKGKICHPVRDATLTGQGMEVMEAVIGVGNDFSLDTSTGQCGKASQWVPVGVGQPSVLISKLLVGGAS